METQSSIPLAEFLRPKEISGDKSKSIDFITHAIKSFEDINEFYDVILLLQPTSPLRKLKHLEKSIKLLKNNLQLDSVINLEMLASYYALKNVFTNGCNEKMYLLYNSETKLLEPFFSQSNCLGLNPKNIKPHSIKNLTFINLYIQALNSEVFLFWLFIVLPSYKTNIFLLPLISNFPVLEKVI